MSVHQAVAEQLKAHGIRKTPFRIELLSLFMDKNQSLSHQDIKAHITSRPDKVTIYRALDDFLDKGLIHKVPDANNVSRYALCPDQCSEHAHDHNHIHFICNQCEETFCLDEVAVPQVKLPDGFEANSVNLTVSGLCKKCGNTGLLQ